MDSATSFELALLVLRVLRTPLLELLVLLILLLMAFRLAALVLHFAGLAVLVLVLLFLAILLVARLILNMVGHFFLLHIIFVAHAKRSTVSSDQRRRFRCRHRAYAWSPRRCKSSQFTWIFADCDTVPRHFQLGSA